MFEDTQVVANPGPGPLKVWFEPWGMPHLLPPGELFRIIGRSTKPGRMEVVETEDSVAVYGWPGSTLRVYNGDVLVDDHRAAVAATFNGTDRGGFMGMPATGRRVTIPVVFLYEFKDGKIVRDRRVYDFTGVLVQVGTIKAKPA